MVYSSESLTIWVLWSDNMIQWPERDLIQQLTVFVIINLLVYSIFRRLRYRKKLSVPILLADELASATSRALEYCYHPREVMQKGYYQFPEKVFGVNTRDGIKVVLPARFLDDLKSNPHLSFKVSIDNDMQVQYTLFGGPPEYIINAIKGNMNTVLPALTPILHRMTKTNVPLLLGAHKEWTAVKVHDQILKLVGTNNARVFQSSEASLDEEWVDASTGYVLSTFDCIKTLKAWSPYLRPFVYLWIPERTAIKGQWTRARKRVVQSINARIAKGGNLEEPPSMLDFLSSGKNEYLANDIDKQLLYQMTLVAVGTVTTFASITQALYDLATYPEYIPALREEILGVTLNQEGLFTKDSLSAMKKLDSFIKESQRLSAPDLSTFQRAATADIVLPDGTFIPKGTKLETNTSSIHVDEKHYQDPHKFDGLRYYRMRQKASEQNKHLYVSVGPNDLSFGYGRHACPGRFLGQVNIKLLLAEILLQYDIKLPPGKGRPQNGEFEAIVSINHYDFIRTIVDIY